MRHLMGGIPRCAVLLAAVAYSAAAWTVSGLAANLDVYILTGQSNSLGTTNLEAVADPGSHPADAATRFFWANAAGGSSSNVAYPAALSSSSAGAITSLQVQGGEGGNSTFWGPEFGFARQFFDVGERDFLVVKASKGGGLNTFWDKTTFDASHDRGHMWGHLRDTVDSALSSVINNGNSFAVKGLMYLQGESNDTRGAQVAGALLGDLIGNLKSHINSQYPRAADDMFAVIGEIAASTSNANRRLTTTQQMQLAASSRTIEFVSTRDLPLKSDGIHFGKTAKLAIGRRFADAFNRHNGSPSARLLAGYRADLGKPAPIPSPTDQGMQAIGAIVPGVTLEAVTDGGTRAWRVSNNSRSASPGYLQSLSAAHFRRMFDEGWSLQATAKVVAGGGQALWSLSQDNDPGWGLSEPHSTIGFTFRRVDGDQLEVSLGQNLPAVNLGPGSANQFHTFQLRGAANSSRYSFYVDGLLQSEGHDLRSTNGLDGFDNLLVLNSGIGSGREVYWNELALTVVPEPATLLLLGWSPLLAGRQRTSRRAP